MHLLPASLAFLCAAVIAITHDSRAAQQSTAAAPIAAMLALDRPNYNGGISREDRALAERIRAAMAARNTGRCVESYDPTHSTYVYYPKDQIPPPPKPLPSLDGVDHDLVALIRALDDPRQQVRDVAAYTIGLLGPSAKQAEPFLSAKFKPETKGGWINFAMARVLCHDVSAPRIGNVLPDPILPGDWRSEKIPALAFSFVAQLYLDPDYEYPPEFLFWLYYAVEPLPRQEIVLQAMVKILEDDRLSEQKHFEAIERIRLLDNIEPALPALLRYVNSPSARIRYELSYALLRIHRLEGLPLLLESLGADNLRDLTTYWQETICKQGMAARELAEDRMIDVAEHAAWPEVRHKAVYVLGCILSRKALPILTQMLSEPDWQINGDAAYAIATIGTPPPATIAALKALAANHWSALVRNLASAALFKLGLGPEPPPPPSGYHADVRHGYFPLPFNHGLQWCDESGRYSIDGRHWFVVKWLQTRAEPWPADFPNPGSPSWDGPQSFLRLSDGWLMGRFSLQFDETFFAFTSLSGERQELGEGQVKISGIVETRGRYFAFGRDFRAGPAGSLFEVRRSADGKWTATRILALPSVPKGSAIAPTGELLLSDGPNDYAIFDGDVRPLKCEKTLPGSYFDKVPIHPWVPPMFDERPSPHGGDNK